MDNTTKTRRITSQGEFNPSFRRVRIGDEAFLTFMMRLVWLWCVPMFGYVIIWYGRYGTNHWYLFKVGEDHPSLSKSSVTSFGLGAGKTSATKSTLKLEIKVGFVLPPTPMHLEQTPSPCQCQGNRSSEGDVTAIHKCERAFCMPAALKFGRDSPVSNVLM